MVIGEGNIAFGRCCHRPITELSIILCFLLLTSCYSYKPLIAKNESYNNVLAEKISRIKIGETYRFFLKGDMSKTIKVLKIENNEIHGETINPTQPYWFSITELEDVQLRKVDGLATTRLVALSAILIFLLANPPIAFGRSLFD